MLRCVPEFCFILCLIPTGCEEQELCGFLPRLSLWEAQTLKAQYPVPQGFTLLAPMTNLNKRQKILKVGCGRPQLNTRRGRLL